MLLSRVLPVFASALLFAGSASALTNHPIINEVDYDQPAADTGEFIELYNPTDLDIDLSGFEVQIINGVGPAIDITIALPADTMGPGDYYVICKDPVPNCDLVVPGPAVGFIMNAIGDGVALATAGSSGGGVGAGVLDSLTYEGVTAGITETAQAPTDLPGAIVNGAGQRRGISRIPNGTDTQDNSADFSVACTTPGEENVDISDCTGSITITKVTDPAGGPSFNFLDDILGLNPVLGDGESQTYDDVSFGTYNVIEGQVPPYVLTSIECSNDSAVNPDTATANIELAIGEDVTCTFTNTIPAPEPEERLGCGTD